MMRRVCFALLRESRRAALFASALILLTLASLPLRAQNGIPGMLWYITNFTNPHYS